MNKSVHNDLRNRLRKLHRAAAYLWALPTTLLALPFALTVPLSRHSHIRLVDGVFEIHGGLTSWFLRKIVPLDAGAAAMTLGHVVLGRNARTLAETRSHERVHVRQAERWGPFFVPAYFMASVVAKLKGGDAYLDNAFEREAYRVG